ncbi:hypothetical protein [Noviherbaspirillum sp.]|uniref:hypothetical protein n=1 Tax=Noviherbaspirillum sp. TaxID=1926288 RepID=UPI002B48175D|nr:hypothetical protein [Noviherbaspirillum sp.]HJV80904.1 hypothetical protein [Noviherbaspirillum sp.]
MDNILFLQSEVDDPYALYARMRADHPVCHDDRADMWAVYSHAGCKRILGASTAHIPAPETSALLSPPAAVLVVLAALFAGDRRVRLLQSRIACEPMVNARLPKQLMIAIESYSS